MSKKTNPIQSSIWIAEQAILLVIAVATIGATIIELVRIFDVTPPGDAAIIITPKAISIGSEII